MKTKVKKKYNLPFQTKKEKWCMSHIGCGLGDLLW